MTKAQTKTKSEKKSKKKAKARSKTAAKATACAQPQGMQGSGSVVANDRFGERAVKLGFCSNEQVLRAVEIQDENARQSRPHKLIGIVLLEEGILDTAQLIEVLKTYEEGKSPIE